MREVPSPRQIVLAEDNPADVELVREALHEHDVSCELLVISDGEEVSIFIDKLDLDTKLPCRDLLPLDLHLPRHDGAEVLKHLRASERCGQTPVVVLSSSELTADQQNAGKNAAAHYFRQPGSLHQFLRLGKIVKELMSRPQLS